MKKAVFFLLAILILSAALTGCGSGEKPCGGIRLPVFVGRSPEHTGPLTEDFAHMAWDFSRETLKIADYPEGVKVWGSADKEGKNTLTVDWQGLRQELDIEFLSGDVFTLEQFFFDCDGDGEKELLLIEPVGGGSGISLKRLHIIEPDGERQQLRDYVLFDELQGPLFEGLRLENNVLSLGGESIELGEGEFEENFGEIAQHFELYDDKITVVYGVGVLEKTGPGELDCFFPAEIRADIIFDEGCVRAENITFNKT